MKEQDTFNELVGRYRGMLFAVCRRYARQGLDVDDLLQEVLVALWERREKLQEIDLAPKQAAWIWRVARSKCIDLQRCTPVQEPLHEGYDAPEEEPSLHNALYDLIALLPELDRTIVTMHLEGYEYKEIAQRTGLTKNNVGIRLMRIKDKLREQWEN